MTEYGFLNDFLRERDLTIGVGFFLDLKAGLQAHGAFGGGNYLIIVSRTGDDNPVTYFEECDRDLMFGRADTIGEEVKSDPDKYK